MENSYISFTIVIIIITETAYQVNEGELVMGKIKSESTAVRWQH